MRQRPRTVIKILIEKASPLSVGRLPINREITPDGIIARLDPVSCAALLASVGKYFPLEEVSSYMIEVAEQYSSNGKKQPINSIGEEDDE
jgi:hypothetical protein